MYIEHNHFLHYFNQQVTENPNNIALRVSATDNYQNITYKKLSDDVDKLALTLLNNYQIKRGDRIAICFKAGDPNIIRLLLVIWKLGAVYVPVASDTKQGPFEKRMENATPKMIITNQELQTMVYAYKTSEMEMVTVTELNNFSTKNFNHVQLPILQENDLAYIMYTSGSTGNPKGVAVPHNALAKRTVQFHQSLQVKKNDCIAQWASIGFDASLQEIISALGCGASLCLVPESVRMLAKQLAEFYNEMAITITTLTPGIVKLLTPETLTTLRTILSTGEAIDVATIMLWIKAGKTFVNGYGPTEAIIGTHLGIYRPGPLNSSLESVSTVHAGVPFDDVRCFFLNDKEEITNDKQGELGVVSPYFNNIYYWQSPKKTSEKFVEITDPQTHQPVRVLKTGDKAVLDSKGNLILKGRLGLKMKKLSATIVDLLEVEKILRQVPGISKAECAFVKDIGGYWQVAACYEVGDEAIFDVTKIYILLALNFPTVAWPSLWYSLTSMTQGNVSLTQHGKINWQKIFTNVKLFMRHLTSRDYHLLLLDSIAKNKIQANVLADIQQQLVKIVIRLIATDKSGEEKLSITAEENLAYIGINSLKLAQLLDIAKSNYPELAEISFSQFLVCPTIAWLARQIIIIRQTLSIAQAKPYGGNMALPHSIPVFVIHAIDGDADEDYKDFSRELSTNKLYQVYHISAPALEDPLMTDESIPMIAARYIAAIEKIKPDANDTPYLIIGWSAGGIIANEMVRQLLEKELSAYCCMVDSESPALIQALTVKQYADQYLLGLCNWFMRFLPGKKSVINNDPSDLKEEAGYQQEEKKKAINFYEGYDNKYDCLEKMVYFLKDHIQTNAEPSRKSHWLKKLLIIRTLARAMLQYTSNYLTFNSQLFMADETVNSWQKYLSVNGIENIVDDNWLTKALVASLGWKKSHKLEPITITDSNHFSLMLLNHNGGEPFKRVQEEIVSFFKKACQVSIQHQVCQLQREQQSVIQKVSGLCQGFQTLVCDQKETGFSHDTRFVYSWRLNTTVVKEVADLFEKLHKFAFTHINFLRDHASQYFDFIYNWLTLLYSYGHFCTQDVCGESDKYQSALAALSDGKKFLEELAKFNLDVEESYAPSVPSDYAKELRIKIYNPLQRLVPKETQKEAPLPLLVNLYIKFLYSYARMFFYNRPFTKEVAQQLLQIAHGLAKIIAQNQPHCQPIHLRLVQTNALLYLALESGDVPTLYQAIYCYQCFLAEGGVYQDDDKVVDLGSDTYHQVMIYRQLARSHLNLSLLEKGKKRQAFLDLAICYAEDAVNLAEQQCQDEGQLSRMADYYNTFARIYIEKFIAGEVSDFDLLIKARKLAFKAIQAIMKKNQYNENIVEYPLAGAYECLAKIALLTITNTNSKDVRGLFQIARCHITRALSIYQELNHHHLQSCQNTFTTLSKTAVVRYWRCKRKQDFHKAKSGATKRSYSSMKI